MTGFLQTRNAEIQAHRHRIEADRWRRGHRDGLEGSASPQEGAGSLAIRIAREQDSAGIRRLYELEGERRNGSALLVAEVEGELVAAVPLDGGTPVADPFQRTAQIVELLRTRAEQLQAAARPPAGPTKRAWRALRRAVGAPAAAPATPGNASLLITRDCD